MSKSKYIEKEVGFVENIEKSRIEKLDVSSR